MADLPDLPDINGEIWEMAKNAIALTMTHKALEVITNQAGASVFIRIDDETGVRIKSLTSEVLITMMTKGGTLHMRISKAQCLSLHEERRTLWSP